MENLALAIVYSNWTITRITNFFQNFFETNGSDIFYSRIIMNRNKETGELYESNKTLFLISRNLMHKANQYNDVIKTANLDFRIDEYNLSAKDFPIVGYSTDYHISFPEEIPLEEIENAINERFKMMVNLGMLNSTDYSITIPLKSRITGIHKGYCRVTFSENVSFQIRTYIKLILHHSVILFDSKREPLRICINWKKNVKTHIKQK